MDYNDSDTHICLRCQTTIIGLDNYIDHRRKQCITAISSGGDSLGQGAVMTSPTLERAPSQLSNLNEDKSPIRPDDFFFLLELQSSNATNKISHYPSPQICAPALNPDFGSDEDSSNDNQGPNPPKRHTGGKWKPGHRPQTDHLHSSLSEDNAEEPGELSCRPCAQSFDTPRDMVTHIISPEHLATAKDHPDWSRLLLTHGDLLAPLAPFRCSQCPFYFHTLSTLKFHFSDWPAHVAPPHRTIYTCSACNIPIDGSDKISGHLEDHGSVSELVIGVHDGLRPFKNYECSTCGAGFKSKTTMWAHRRNLHLNYGRFSCKECGFKCSTSTKLRIHEETHAKDRVKGFSCAVCGKGFYRKYQLTQHEKRHSDETRIHKCTFEGCDSSFRVASELVYHIRTHTDEKPYLCDICGNSFPCGRSLTKHIRNVHSNRRPFLCPRCPYSATQKGQLHRHLRVHTGSKPFGCPHCDYRGSSQDNLRKHMSKFKGHAGLKLYLCPNCPFSTDTASALFRHGKDTHGEGPNTRATVFANIYSEEADAADLIKL